MRFQARRHRTESASIELADHTPHFNMVYFVESHEDHITPIDRKALRGKIKSGFLLGFCQRRHGTVYQDENLKLVYIVYFIAI